MMKDDSSVSENPKAAPTEEERLKKRTYITFIGKAPQDVGFVIAIYQALSHQLQIDFPNIKYIIVKSDNASCYHNEVIFTWKATWPWKTLNISFIETIFNERQSGKDQCDREITLRHPSKCMMLCVKQQLYLDSQLVCLTSKKESPTPKQRK